ncbi:alpha-ketoglutarate-dependent dioxygenase AlkB [Gordonia sp. SL306]|uniref:alpha-ketoglutarate-dependent dioxygenase AlkB n=1 Tax=Gordonia sp. SL306 TaxID=2995145 RepID=UPI002271B15C|nr:alpha-ketoglutarate-dependent dioxygenase AlkB [Gordonia sp. SL306]WAC54298.1 alpha-ketoglutarate-dependent dioxygenase AlkB [Gordonia sp. SL306]
MTAGIQRSLFDQQCDQTSIGDLDATTRRMLTDGAWVDLRPGWIAGSDLLFDALREKADWRTERRRMYDRVVDVPRLVSTYLEAAAFPDPLLREARERLSRHYRDELPEGFATAGLCLYRDGSDSVAWHGDRIGRGSTADTMVAIVSLGSPRPLMLRPRGGGSSVRFVVGPGDLLVMGGSCQRTWEHAVPKSPGVGPRISVQFRPPGVW